jgi:hypothetical protein
MTLSISVDLAKRSFAVETSPTSHRFGIPEGYDIHVTDLKEIVETAAALGQVDPSHWWEFYHDRRVERDEFTTSRFTLVYAGDQNISGCYIEWNCDAEGHERGCGYRGTGAGEDRLGGIVTDQLMDGISYKLANQEQDARKEGYALEGRWLIRILEDAETDVLVQARIPASWSKPARWTAIPLNE